ncbi:MAG: PDZ domain-containing protein [Planctomycetes bacterium]|nr:PDZ domain-containing protein [Planctomycetota bacterium]
MLDSLLVRRRPYVLSFAASLLIALPAAAQEPESPPAPATDAPAAAAEPAVAKPDPDAVFAAVAGSTPWRLLGTANMGGRVTDVEAHPDQRNIWYLGTACAGVWKTVNAGTTWERVFQGEGSASIGDVAVAPSNPDVVWVGTGEENARNSVTFGDGVYKSTDGGRTFAHMGLRESLQTGHIAIHPRDADIVFVAALGRFWGANPDRGVFRTKDGGKTWQKVLYVDDATGAIDVRVDPLEPSIVHACLYQVRRDEFCSNDPAVRFGEHAGYYRSEDGGDTWTRVTAGLPTCKWGRSGLTVFAPDPQKLYLIIESERSGWATGSQRMRGDDESGNAYLGVQAENPPEGDGAKLTSITKDGPAATAGLQSGDLVVALGEESIETWPDLQRAIRRAKGGEKAKLKVKRDGQDLEIEVTWGTREGEGETDADPYAGPYSGRLYGQRENVQLRQGKDGHETGGVFRSEDRGVTWKRVNSLTDRPFYFSKLAVDPGNVDVIWSCGVPVFKSTDGGKRFRQVQRSIHVDFHALWVDPKDGDHVLLGGDGGLHETHDGARTWAHVDNLSLGQWYHVDVDTSDPYRVYGGLQDNGTWGGPVLTRWTEGIAIGDWVTLAGGDGFGAAADQTEAGIVICTSQNGGLVRADLRNGGNGGVRKPGDAGPFNWDTPFFLSPHNQKILYFAGRRAVRSLDQGRNSTSISPELGLTKRGTATAMAESPLEAGLLYAGTDDGAFWRSRDGGANWEEIHDKVTGLRGPRYVSSIHPSRHEAGRVYVTFDGHRSDDNSTYVFVSEDHGDSWRSLTESLPKEQPCFCVVEDPRVEDLLFLGTETTCWASRDRGTSWHRFAKELPTVQVRDLVIQDRDADLVAATHGHGAAVIDISALRQIDADTGKDGVHLFRPELVTRWVMRSRGTQGNREWFSANPPSGATIRVWTQQAPPANTRVAILDIRGETVATLDLAEESGAQTLRWEMRGAGRRRGREVEAGSYAARLTIGEKSWSVPITVRDDPSAASHPFAEAAFPTTRQ